MIADNLPVIRAFALLLPGMVVAVEMASSRVVGRWIDMGPAFCLWALSVLGMYVVGWSTFRIDTAREMIARAIAWYVVATMMAVIGPACAVELLHEVFTLLGA